MSIVDLVLKRPYTVPAVLILICLLGLGAALRMPVDIFPEIDIPVVSVVWTYNGMSPQDMQNRILTLHERQLASLVDDIARIEATSYYGIGVEKVYLHEGADVTRAVLAGDFLRERRIVLEKLARLGIHCIDVRADQLTTSLLNRYLLIKQRGLL